MGSNASIFSPEVSVSAVNAEIDAPLIIRSNLSGDAREAWIAAHKNPIEDELRRCGALIFRGFDISGPESLSAFVAKTSADSPVFKEESSPRSQVKGAVFTSTDYPEDYEIQFHNEYSYANAWPMKLYFACIIPSATDGETPIASTRNLLRRLKPDTVKAFRERGVMYLRNFSEGIGVDWRSAFQTTDKAAVEAYCKAQGISCEWLPGNALRTRKVQEAIVRHPKTGEDLWFNHGYFFNVQSLEPDEIREYFLSQPQESLPTNTYFGDGETISEAVIEEIRAAYRQEGIRVPWQKGDLMLIDNMLVSHGRSSYSGARKILVQMADGFHRSHLR